MADRETWVKKKDRHDATEATMYRKGSDRDIENADSWMKRDVL